ncbi:putative polyol transporter 2 [Curcuma longa]|uniref:putative polyol transporter 2 n=1 Tax=Curcuma longa TaxID=136217 RepID=UPI003D9E08AA
MTDQEVGANNEMISDARAAPTNPRNKRFAVACALLASMTSIILGYDIGVMSGAAIFIKEDLKITDTEIEILLGILNIYSLVGSYAAGFTSDWIGRRYTIVLAAGFFFVGALLMGFATGYVFLMVGRFVAGIGVGYALMIAPVYTAEVAPASSRGFLTSFPEVFINIGILLGYVSNYTFSHLRTSIGWRFMLGVGAIPSIFLASGVLAMPESPRWLVLRGRLREASLVLEMTSDTPDEARLRLEEIKAAAGIPAECDEDCTVPKGTDYKTKGGSDREMAVWKELLLRPTPAVRRALLMAVGIHFFQQASGIDSVVLYSPRVFEKAGIRENKKLLGTTVALGFTKTLFILVATFLLDRVGRRPLLLGSTGGMLFSLLGLGLGLTLVDHGREGAVGLCVASILAYVAFFSIGMGPVTWVYGSEILPLRLRAQGASIAVAVNRVTSGVITMTFISLYKAITIGGSFFLYGGVAAIAWVFFFTCLPETRGRTLEDIEDLLAMGKDKEKAPADGVEMPTTNSTSANATPQR